MKKYVNAHSDQSIAGVLFHFLKKNGYRVTYQAVWDKLSIHPNYPSLASITDTLTSFRVKNRLMKVDSSKLLREGVETDEPFMTFINSNDDDQELCIVNQIKNNTVSYTNSSLKNQQKNIEDFFSIWDGVILYSRVEETKSDSFYFEKKIFEARYSVLFFCFALMFIISSVYFIQAGNIRMFIVHALNALGLGVSYMLFEVHNNVHNVLFFKGCSTKANEGGCKELIKSKISEKNFKDISWSDMGVLYFSFSILFVSLSSMSNITLTAFVVFGFNLIGVLFSLYSFYEQFVRSRIFCFWCTLVMVIFWLVALTLVGSIDLSTDFILFFSPTFFNNFLVAILVVPVWVFLKKDFGDAKKIINYLKLIKYLKFSPQATEFMSNTEPIKVALSDDYFPIVLWGEDGDACENEIVVVINLFCEPCRMVYEKLDEYIRSEYPSLSIKMLLAVDENTESLNYRMGSLFIKLYKEKGAEAFIEAMNFWFLANDKNAQVFIDRFSVGLNSECKTSEVVKMHAKWIRENEIYTTPTVLFNKKRLPPVYGIDDLRFFI